MTDARALIRPYLHHLPTLGERVYIDPAAVVIGDVVLGDDVSVWPATVIRGDVNFIRIGARTNLQDGSVIHVSHDGPHAKLGGFATRIGEDLVATYHQHIFSFRLDFEVDGHRNSVLENDAVRIPVGPDNPTGAAFTVRKRLLESELDGIGLTDPQVSRNWTVVNRDKTNAWGVPVGYKLLPGWASATLLAQDEAPVAKRAGFASVDELDAEDYALPTPLPYKRSQG